MSCCRGHASNYWCERHPDVYKDAQKNNYCIFHAPADFKGLDTNLYIDLVFEEIEHAKTNNKECSLAIAIIIGDISFTRYDKDHPLPPLNLKEALFEGAVDFSGVTFAGKLDLTRTEFKKEVTFFEADFQDEALFFDSIFNEKVDFKSVTFEKIVCISWGSFKNGADMGGTTYGGKLLLKRPVV